MKNEEYNKNMIEVAKSAIRQYVDKMIPGACVGVSENEVKLTNVPEDVLESQIESTTRYVAEMLGVPYGIGEVAITDPSDNGGFFAKASRSATIKI